MKPLVFLTVRSLYNSVKRALSSPKRLVGVLFFVGYYFWLFNPLRQMRMSQRLTLPAGQQLEVPPIAVIEAVVFGLFAVATLFFALGVFGYRGGFRAADVDVLFPTPVSPKLVLIFRLVRDTLLTLLVPLVLTLLMFRPISAGWEGLFRNLPNPEYSGLILRFGTASYLLIALSWVAIGYAATLFVNRPEPRFELWRRVGFWTILVGVAALVGYVGLLLRGADSAGDLVGISQNPGLRTALFLGTFATWTTMAPLTASAPLGVAGFLGLVGTIVAAVWLAVRQSGWVYEEAALHTSLSAKTRALQRQGDVYGMLAEQARAGKLKSGRKSWVHRARATGPLALIWKEYLLQARTARGTLLFFVAVNVLMGLTPLLVPSRASTMAVGGLMTAMLAFGVFIATASLSNIGYLELLRRVDLQKPLPFSPSKIVLAEVAAKALVSTVSAVAAVLLVTAIRPELWQWGLGNLFFMPSLALLLSSVFFAAIVLLPDIDDPTQRGFRGLITMIALAVFCAPAAGLFLLLAYLRVWPLVAALPAAGLNVALALVAAAVAGKLYQAYNPSE